MERTPDNKHTVSIVRRAMEKFPIDVGSNQEILKHEERRLFFFFFFSFFFAVVR